MIYNLFEKIPKNYYLAFVIGLLSSLPSLAPTALSLQNNPSCDLYKTAGFEDMFMQIPLFYGVLHIVIFFLMFLILPENWRNYWVLGFIVAVLYPTFGTVSGHAKKVYGIKSTPMLYLNAQIMYLTFYGIIINFLMTNIRK